MAEVTPESFWALVAIKAINLVLPSIRFPSIMKIRNHSLVKDLLIKFRCTLVQMELSDRDNRSAFATKPSARRSLLSRRFGDMRKNGATWRRLAVHSLFL